ncbi:MAG TPA: site-specific DNA-methyltransferase, partial [Erysipelotrichaceae bacterium]|nr:site-specific DNA-methyltransferase [Erysipelotrichaceae bacterium]
LVPDKESSVDFDNTKNIYIEGDNFVVLKILQESYLNKIKMIYIDPPYNTGTDFVYKDDFKKTKEEYEEDLGVEDEEGGRLFKNTDTNGRFHSDWLSMMYERLVIARDLLKDDGVIFISIDDNEVHNLRKICDEIFGEENFITILKWNKTSTPPSLSKKIRHKYEFILCYEKKNNNIEYIGGTSEGGDMPLLNDGNSIDILKIPKEKIIFNFDGEYSPGKYDRVELINKIIIKNGLSNEDLILKGPFKWKQENTNNEINEGTTFIIKTEKFAIRYVRDGLRNKKPSDIISKTECGVGTNEDGNKEIGELFGENIMSFPKPSSLIKYLLKFVSFNDDIILDFFSGSATTAHSVMKLNAEDGGNRKFVMVQLPEKTDEDSEAYKAGYKTIPEIGRERIRRAGKKIVEENADKLKERETPLDIGFRAYKVADSIMRDVYKSPNDLKQGELLGLSDNIREDKKPEDILTSVILDLGLTLDLSIKEEKIDKNTIFNVDDGSLVACFDKNIDFNVIDEIAKMKPLKVVFRDASFKDDKDRINVETKFKQLSPDTNIKVI